MSVNNPLRPPTFGGGNVPQHDESYYDANELYEQFIAGPHNISQYTHL